MTTEDIRSEIQRSLGRIEAALAALERDRAAMGVKVEKLETFRTVSIANFIMLAASMAPKTWGFLTALLQIH